MHLIIRLLPLLVVLTVSCTIQKRLHRGGYTVTWHKHTPSSAQQSVETNEPTFPDVAALESTPQLVPTFPEPIPAEVMEHQQVAVLNPCDTLRMRDGSAVTGIVTLVSPTEIRYKRCDQSGPEYVENKNDVASIRYADGREEVIKKPATAAAIQPASRPKEVVKQRQEGFGIAGFILSILGFVVAGIPMGLLGIIFGAVGLSRIFKNPGTMKGTGFAVFSIVLGLFVLLLTTIIVL